MRDLPAVTSRPAVMYDAYILYFICLYDSVSASGRMSKSRCPPNNACQVNSPSSACRKNGTERIAAMTGYPE